MGIEQINEENRYKNVGILETDGVKNPEKNEKIQKEYTRETEN